MPEESTDREPPGRADATINNQVSGPLGPVVQARDVHGDVHIGAHADNDVEIVLQPEQPEVAVGAGDEHTIPLTVNSHLAQPVTVKLSLRGAGTSQWTVEPGEVTVRPGVPALAVVRLPCTATEPPAGPKYLRVVARPRGGKREWQSKPAVTVTVQPQPGLAVESKVAPGVLGGRKQKTRVIVRNTGNTRLAGSLRPWIPSAGDARYLALDAVRLPDGNTLPFRLEPGGVTEQPVVVTLPPPNVTARQWQLPIAAWLDGTEQPCAVPALTVTQPGWLEQIPGHVRRLARWARVEHGPYRRVTLAICGIAVFVVGLLFGANVLPAQPTGAEPAPSSDQAATVPSVPPLFAPVHYERMACTAGTSVVYLGSMTRREADAYAAYFVQREHSRMNALKVPVGQRYTIHVSSRDDLCPVERKRLDSESKMAAYSTFIWMSVPTGEAAGTCANLGLQPGPDCTVVSIN